MNLWQFKYLKKDSCQWSTCSLKVISQEFLYLTYEGGENRVQEELVQDGFFTGSFQKVLNIRLKVNPTKSVKIDLVAGN